MEKPQGRLLPFYLSGPSEQWGPSLCHWLSRCQALCHRWSSGFSLVGVVTIMGMLPTQQDPSLAADSVPLCHLLSGAAPPGQHPCLFPHSCSQTGCCTPALSCCILCGHWAFAPPWLTLKEHSAALLYLTMLCNIVTIILCTLGTPLIRGMKCNLQTSPAQYP